MKTMRTLVITLIVAVLLLSACGGKEATTQPAPEAKATTAPTAEPAKPTLPPTKPPAKEEPTATPEPPTPEPTPEELALSSVTEGLASLKSYKSTFTLVWAGKDEDGEPVQGAWDMVEEYTRQPLAQRIIITSKELGDDDGKPFELITIGDVAYMVSTGDDGEVSCMSFSSSDTGVTEQGLYTPDMLGSISGAGYVGTETVNGVRTKHYAWKERNVVLAGLASASGDVWTTMDGKTVVKYTTEATGKGMFFGAGEAEGTVSVEYNLTEIDGDFQIAPPEGCKGPSTDIPLMADATDRSSFGEMLTYTSPSPIADVVEFYKAEMPKSGWELSGDPTEMGDLYMLDFTKEGRKASLMITYDEDDKLTSVMITTGEE